MLKKTETGSCEYCSSCVYDEDYAENIFKTILTSRNLCYIIIFAVEDDSAEPNVVWA